MKAKEDYWERLFKGYERSGLSQEAFCRERGIPIAKFKYQWRKKHPKPGTKCILNKPSSFEPIVISNKNVDEPEPVTSQSIIIRFPNQIYCEVKADIKSKEFSSLLTHLTQEGLTRP